MYVMYRGAAVPATALCATRRVPQGSTVRRNREGKGIAAAATAVDCGGSNLLVSNRPDKLLACARRSKASTAIAAAICVCGCTE